MKNLQEIRELMGSETTVSEAHAMMQILETRGLDVDDLSDREFFALIPDAIELAQTA
jgi:hypothetical protein